MATAKKTTRPSRKSSDTLVEGDGDLADFLPRGRKGREMQLPEPLENAAGALPDDDDEGPLGAVEMDGFPQSNRKADELRSQMMARATGKPTFPYPPELPDDHKPYWLELVNSFPKDHFQVSDITMMKLYCRCAADIERTTKMIEEEGEVVMGGRGPMVNPRVKVRGDAINTLMSLATKFRNQPASRVNTENFGQRQEKAQKAAGAASTVAGDEDGLLAGGASRTLQ